MKALHAGYISGALWKAIQDDELSSDLNWQDILNGLSHFVIDRDVGGDGIHTPELSVLENIICRGLPTLPSLYVEKKLEKITGSIKCGISGKKEISSYSCRLNAELPTSFTQLLEQALCIASPQSDLEPSSGFIFPEFGSGEENTNFDSEAERDFWNGPLSDLVGKGGMQLALRQRPLDTIVADGFLEQRVDVSLSLPGAIPKGIVLEVDGTTHSTEAAKINDSRRDEACASVGYAKTYRHQLWNGINTTTSINQSHLGISQIIKHPYLQRINQNIKEPLENSELGRKAKTLTLFPFAVARIQRVMLELIRGGLLDMSAPSWDIVVLDRDGLAGCGITAARDLRLWIKKLRDLYSPEATAPVIRVHEISALSSKASLPQKADALLDVSVLMRYGVSLPTPSIFTNLETTTNRVVIRSDYYNREPDHFLSFGNPLLPQISGEVLENKLKFFLQNIFRKKAFRPKQAEIIVRALRGESVIALLPTGAGKSITYQLPTLLQNGMSLVIAPIKSLMKDQDDNLKAIGIDRSAFINSMSAAKERRNSTVLMQKGSFKFVFISPERFVIQDFRDALDSIRNEGKVHFTYVVVDEAHCVSEWGHDFRTAYLRLGVNARKYCVTQWPKLPLLALTGTASFEVLDDVKIELEYSKDDDICVRPDKMERENLKFHVAPLMHPPSIPENATETTIRNSIGDTKLKELPEVLSAIAIELGDESFEAFLNAPHGAGLIFCPHKSSKSKYGAESVYNTLQSYPSFVNANGKFNVYYGSSEESKSLKKFDPVQVQNDFKKGKLKLLACTKAFGMGIDKSDIRFTLHYNIPPSLESFYQEAGRAGRDGEDAQCWIMYAGTSIPGKNQRLDYSLNHWFHTNSFPGAQIEEKKAFEILDRNRRPAPSIRDDISAMLCKATGVLYTLSEPSPYNGSHYIFINHPDHKESKVYIVISPNDDIKLKHKDNANLFCFSRKWTFRPLDLRVSQLPLNA